MGDALAIDGIGLVLLAVLVAAAAAALIREGRRDRAETEAFAALGRRYDRGEIGRDDYLAACRHLERRNDGGPS